MQVAAMQAAQTDVQSRLIMFEYAEFGSLNRLLRKACEPLLTADDPRKANPPPRLLFFCPCIPSQDLAVVLYIYDMNDQDNLLVKM